MRPGGHGQAWDQLEACRAEIEAQVKRSLSVVKVGVLLERQGVVVGQTASTVRVADGEPGAECQIDFGYLGMSATRPSSWPARSTGVVVALAAHNGTAPALMGSWTACARDSLRLARRFRDHRDMILRFTTDLGVGFISNQAGGDVRPVKVQQRTSPAVAGNTRRACRLRNGPVLRI